MDAMKLCMAIAVSATLATSIAADAESISRRVDDFSGSDHGQALALHSRSDGAAANRVVVTRAEPATFHGLRAGDVILAVDGMPLHQVEALMRALQRRAASARLRVLRGSVEATLVWSQADHRVIASPPPPAPPVPHIRILCLR